MPPPSTARKHTSKVRPERLRSLQIHDPVQIPEDPNVPPMPEPGSPEYVEFLKLLRESGAPEWAEIEQWANWKPRTYPTFLEFARRTVTFSLDPWQEHMCERLGRLDKEKGQRILLCAGPQLGKSIFVSQRLPAWYIGAHPDHRVRLACYNIDHAARFGGIVRDVLKGRDFQEMFPGGQCKLPGVCSAEEWTTAARAQLQDSQPSFKALGLQTGFVGSGAELLIVDDPYASPLEAYSSIVREKVFTFWSDAAKPRLGPDCNVVVMFHRYHMDDIAGRLKNEGGWEVLRYAAQADGEEDCKPEGRPIGAFLTDRYPAAWWESQQKNTMTWLSQYQGKPAPKEGAFFDIDKIEQVAEVPDGLRKCRAWDLASTAHSGDYTAGPRIEGPDERGFWYVTDLRRGKWATDERNRQMLQTAQTDPPGTVIRLSQDPGQAGKDQAAALTRMLAGFNVKAVYESGSKQTRADPFSAQVNAGNVKIVKASWNAALLDEMATFPYGTNDDIVDSLSSGFAELTRRRVARMA